MMNDIKYIYMKTQGNIPLRRTFIVVIMELLPCCDLGLDAGNISVLDVSQRPRSEDV